MSAHLLETIGKNERAMARCGRVLVDLAMSIMLLRCGTTPNMRNTGRRPAA